MTFLRDETRRHGFPTPDGVHNGPCHVHMKHAHTIGPDGSLYACPGFTGEKAHVDRPHRRPRRLVARNGARAVLTTQSLEGMRGLRLHPGVCRGMHREFAHNAWRHEYADMSQARVRLGGRFAGTYRRQRNCSIGAHHEDHRHQEGHERETDRLLPRLRRRHRRWARSNTADRRAARTSAPAQLQLRSTS